MNPFVARRRNGGFTNQQAIFVLLLFFPVGLIGLGLVVMLLRRPSVPIAQPPTSAPAQPAPTAAPPTFTPCIPAGLRVERSPCPRCRRAVAVRQGADLRSPYDTNVADRIVAEGPLWSDLTKTNGSIDWLKSNNSYYSYNTSRVNNVIRFTPSQTMPSLLVSVTEDSVLHSPNGSDPSVSTKNYLYTLKEENGVWKVWDYRKQ